MLRSVASTTRCFSTTATPKLEEVLVNAVKNAKIQPVLPPKRVVILPPTDDIARKVCNNSSFHRTGSFIQSYSFLRLSITFFSTKRISLPVEAMR